MKGLPDRTIKTYNHSTKFYGSVLFETAFAVPLIIPILKIASYVHARNIKRDDYMPL